MTNWNKGEDAMEIAYKKDGNENYMIIREHKINENDYKVQMVINNNIDGIIPISIRNINNTQELIYKTTSMLSLENMYAKKGMSGEDFFELIKAIRNLFENMKEYLLEPKNIMFEAGNIFVKRQTNKYMFCYCPDNEDDIQDSLRNLFDRLLEYTDHNDKKAVLIAYDIQRITISDDFTIGDLMQCAEKHIKESREEKVVVKENLEVNRIIEEDEEEKQSKNILKKFVEILKRKSKYKNEKDLEEEDTYIGDFREYSYIAEDTDVYGESGEDATMLLTSSGAISTITLRSLNLEQELKITPTVFPCVLGNSRKSSDFLVNNPVVSRVHMRVSEEFAEYYVEDLNSTNGTFINGVRLTPHIPKEITVGDKITMANVDFIVE